MRLSRSVPRTCRRPGCPGWPTASLSFRYADAQVHLLDLVDEPHPTRWDLCSVHADALQVPRGWERIDERGTRTTRRTGGSVAEPPLDDSARDNGPPTASTTDVPDARPPAGPSHPARRNRYAALSARLPQLAAGHTSTDDGSAAGTTGPAEEPEVRTGRRVGPGRDEHETGPVIDNVPGQLAMPVGDPILAADVDTDLGFATDAAHRLRDNVVPLVRRSLLDSVP